MIPKEILDWLNELFGVLDSFTPASGGCINNGGTIVIGKNRMFIKWNSAVKYPKMFEAEAKGLKLLSNSQFHVPDVIDEFNGQEYDALLLENIEKGASKLGFWEEFGQQLAEMHRITNSDYGLDHNNYIGALIQENEPLESWINFFIGRRLMPQVSLAQANGYFSSDQMNSFEKFYQKLPELLFEGQPSLVHGDLWSGNFMVSQNGEPILIDPAVSYSHREVDLAMSKLFGGFDRAFYDAYNESFPSEPNLEDRLDIYNLYPLLIHLNLFGSGYYSQVIHIINRFK